MAKNRIFIVGFTLPNDDFEYIPFDSDQSLLDADIILYEVGFGDYYPSESYQGEDLFSRQSSARIAQNLQHWRSEIAAATNAGKIVIVFLAKPLRYFRYTGEQQFSGTGRSRVTTNTVAPVESYDAIAYINDIVAKSGREVRLTKESSYLLPYWQEFAPYSTYEAFIYGKFSHAILKTKTGNKTVAAAVLDKGALLFLPPLRYDENKFVEFDSEDEPYWTPEAVKFGKRLSSALIALSKSLLSGRSISPPPQWALNSKYVTPEEATFHNKIAKLSKTINKLQQKRTEEEELLEEAGSIRALLYEQGKPLERAVRNALTVLGFSADSLAENDLEFDVIFESSEGRCLGEVEGKDNRAINIDKFSQLERNIQEDFAREEITEYAKGVLFGNAERLKAPEERAEAFTSKCIIAAKRIGAALVRTADLFEPIRYLRSYSDTEYAKSCRKAILETEGDVVTFSSVPVSTEIQVQQNDKTTE